MSAPAPADAGRHDVVVIGASAGGVEALRTVVSSLPADLPAAVCVVLHIAPQSPSALAGILARAGMLPCHPATDGAPLRRGEILVAPPDRHLEIKDGHVALSVGPRENGHRPSVDNLFRTASRLDGRVIGVVLSGSRGDGTAGLAAIKASGGVAVVQDPADALYAGMPASAIANVPVDAIASSHNLGSILTAMVNGEAVPDPPAPESPGPAPTERRLTSVCPECGGVLTEVDEGTAIQWECHVGHRYSPRSLADSQGEAVEKALWTAVRMLSDRGALLARMAVQADARGQRRSARRFRAQADEANAQGELVRRALAEAASTTLLGVGELEEDEPGAQSAVA